MREDEVGEKTSRDEDGEMRRSIGTDERRK